MNKEEVFNLIKGNSYSDCKRVVLGNLIELRLNEDCVDVYKYTDLDVVEDNYDFDSDYITTIYF